MGGAVGAWIGIIGFIALLVWAVKSNNKRLAAKARGSVHVVTVGVNRVNGTIAKFSRMGYVLVQQSSANDPKLWNFGSQIRVTLTFRKERDATPVGGVAEPQHTQAQAPPAGTVIEAATFQFVNYSGGLPIHRQPEPKGTLILPGTGPTFARWELHWATGSGLATEHPFVHGGLARYPLKVEARGTVGSRITISDAQNPTIRGHFDLPNTVPGAVNRALTARAGAVAVAKKGLEVVHKQAAPSSRLGIADELAKLADLRDKGVMSDAEFEAEKAKLLS